MIFRQGDVLLHKVKALPKNVTEVPVTEDGKVILAWGEATGHHHRIENVIKDNPKVRLWSADAERFLQVLVKCELRHEEHTSITLEPGIYKLPTQVEYTPKELRRVVD